MFVLLADSDCDRSGSVIVSASSVVGTSGRPLFVQTQDLQLDGLLNASQSLMTLSTCSTPTGSYSIDVGGAGIGSGDLRVSRAELSRMIAQNLTLQSLGSGSINVYEVDASNWQSISSLVLLDASGSQGSVTFWQSSVWRTLSVLAGNGVSVQASVTTVGGDLVLEGNSDQVASASVPYEITVSAGAFLTVSYLNAQLVLGPSLTSRISASAPLRWLSTGGIQVLSPLVVQQGAGQVLMYADSDAEGSGTLLIGSSSSVQVGLPVGSGSTVMLYAADYDVQSVTGIVTGSAPLTVQPSYATRLLKVGGVQSSAPPMAHLSDVELNRLQTTGALTLGGSASSTVLVDGARYTGGASAVQIWAQVAISSLRSTVTFGNSSSSFTQSIDVRSTGFVQFNADVSAAVSSSLASGISIVADSDCDRSGDLVILSTAVVSSSNRPFTVRSQDMHIDGVISAGTSTLLVSSCVSAVTPYVTQVGGSGTGLADLRISQFELSRMIAQNLTLQALSSGSIHVYSVAAADVSGISNLVLLDASGSQGSVMFWQPSSWRTLTVLAGNGVFVRASITTVGGDLVLEGNADLRASPPSIRHCFLWWSLFGSEFSQ